MKKLLNTLFVTTEGAYLRKKRETVVVEINNETVLKLPLIALSNIYCIGRINMSPAFMQHCMKMGIGIAFFSLYGRFMARVQGPKSGNVLLRRQHYRWADDVEHTSDIARYIIGAKISNSRNVLQRALRNKPDIKGRDEIKTAIGRLYFSLKQAQNTFDLDTLRGIEGDAANVYFGVFDHLISTQKDSFVFSGRNRRPPRDAVNATMSFLYAIILQDCVSALEAAGLDSYVGFLHRDRPGRQSLALDLMEEFRAMLGDRIVLSMINRQQVSVDDFEMSENGAVYIGDKVKKKVLAEYQSKKQNEIVHPVIGEKIRVGLLFHVQSMLLSRHIRGDLEYYPAYVWR
jgi:CRISPR-associated protein Cas1